MDSRREGNGLRRKFEGHLLESFARIRHSNLRIYDLFLEILRDKSRRGARPAESREVARITVESNFARSRFGHGSHPGNCGIRIARHNAAAHFRQLSYL